MNIDIDKMINGGIKDLEPYKPEIINCSISMEANENPFTINSSLKDKIIESISKIPLNRYPDPSAIDLRKTISKKIGVEQDNIIIGNGSDEIIQMLIAAFCEKGERILYPTPTFSMFGIAAKSLGASTIEVPLNAEWDIDLGNIKKESDKNRPKIIFLSSPNNPTGNSFSETKILEIIKTIPALIVIDEAYGEFCDKSYLGELGQSNNLIILKTLSKIGMAGLRIGYLIGSEEITGVLNKVRLPYNSNSLSQAAAKVILENDEVVKSQIKRIVEGREFLRQKLEELQKTGSITVYPTNANFFLIKTNMDADDAHKKIEEEGILVRNLNSDGPLKNCLRVTVGRPEENEAFIKAFKKAVS